MDNSSEVIKFEGNVKVVIKIIFLYNYTTVAPITYFMIVYKLYKRFHLQHRRFIQYI